MAQRPLIISMAMAMALFSCDDDDRSDTSTRTARRSIQRTPLFEEPDGDERRPTSRDDGKSVAAPEPEPEPESEPESEPSADEAASTTPASSAESSSTPSIERDLQLDVPSDYEVLTAEPCSGEHSQVAGKRKQFRIAGEPGPGRWVGGRASNCGDIEQNTRFLDRSEDTGDTYEVKQKRSSGNLELVIRKRDGNGTTVWSESIPTGKTTATAHFVAASARGAFIGGSTNGQLPGNPVSAKDGSWLLYITSDGHLEWMKQYSSSDESFADVFGNNTALPVSMAIGHDGSLYLSLEGNADTVVIRRVSPGGALVWQERGLRDTHCGFHFRTSPDGHVFLQGTDREIDEDGNGSVCLARLDGDGHRQWTKRFSVPHRSEVIDDVEGTTWTTKGFGSGSRPPTVSMVSDGNQIALVGALSNTFEHGSSPPPDFVSLWVTLLDHEGSTKSSRHIRVGPLATDIGETGSATSFLPEAVVFLPSGELRIVGTRGSLRHGSYIRPQNGRVYLTLQTDPKENGASLQHAAGAAVDSSAAALGLDAPELDASPKQLLRSFGHFVHSTTTPTKGPKGPV